MVKAQILKTIKDNSLIQAGDNIVIGLSGGPDSSCLFDVLLKLQERLEISIHPVHVNHKFRPGAAEADQAYVEELCARKGLKCHSFVVDCIAMARDTKMTVEEAGRVARYDAFYKVAKGLEGPVKIAVAQNANDQAETVLFRLLRGSGTDGLAGMAYSRQERGYEVIRPLLDVWREDIEKYCDAEKLNPVIDHTNSDNTYARNKIRLDLLPLLEQEYNDNIQAGLVRLSRIAGADKDYLWQQTEEAFRRLQVPADKVQVPADGSEAQGESDGYAPESLCFDRAGLAAEHPAIRHRIILKAFGEIGLEKDITEERLVAADAIILKKQGPKQVEFPRGFFIRVAAGIVKISKSSFVSN